MQEKRIAAKTLTDTEESLYTNSAGAIVKTILLHNSNATEKEVTLNIDGVTFLFKLSTKESKILNSPKIPPGNDNISSVIIFKFLKDTGEHNLMCSLVK